MRWLLNVAIASALGAMTACGFVGHGTSDDTLDVAPDAPAIDEPVAAGDTDGDGYLDPDDDCPLVNDPDQHDHDGDGRGDMCDRCPHLADDGRDSDDDGVGDACDPHPITAGDRIAFFEGFYADPQWHAVIGDDSWTTSAGAMEQHRTDRDYQLVNDTAPLGDVIVEARARIDQIAGTGDRRSIGIVTGYRDTSNYWFCGVAASTSPNTGEVNAGKVSFDLIHPFAFNSAGMAGQITGDWQILRARSHPSTDPTQPGTTIECRVSRAALTSAATYTTNDAGSGSIGLRTNGADASFDYVFVVVTPSP